MRWTERLKKIAGWDLFLQILAVGVLFALGAFVLITQSCQGEANANARIKRANAIPAIQQEPTPAIDLGSVNQTKANEVRDLIAKELAHGASSEAIEQFFGRHEITYSFNRFDDRYQAIVRDVATGPGVDQAVVIHVHVDEQRRFLGAEVRDSFTAP